VKQLFCPLTDPGQSVMLLQGPGRVTRDAARSIEAGEFINPTENSMTIIVVGMS
jgi:hypothetical protein